MRARAAARHLTHRAPVTFLAGIPPPSQAAALPLVRSAAESLVEAPQRSPERNRANRRSRRSPAICRRPPGCAPGSRPGPPEVVEHRSAISGARPRGAWKSGSTPSTSIQPVGSSRPNSPERTSPSMKPTTLLVRPLPPARPPGRAADSRPPDAPRPPAGTSPEIFSSISHDAADVELVDGPDPDLCLRFGHGDLTPVEGCRAPSWRAARTCSKSIGSPTTTQTRHTPHGYRSESGRQRIQRPATAGSGDSRRALPTARVERG